MCEICLMHPCHSRCPNAPEPENIGHCEQCNSPILVGEEYYNINEELVCDNCLYDFCKQFKKVAEGEC